MNRKTLCQWSAGGENSPASYLPRVFDVDACGMALWGVAQNSVRAQPRSGGISSRCGSPVGGVAPPSWPQIRLTEAEGRASAGGLIPKRSYAERPRGAGHRTVLSSAVRGQARPCSICAPARFPARAGALATGIRRLGSRIGQAISSSRSVKNLPRLLQPRRRNVSGGLLSALQLTHSADLFPRNNSAGSQAQLPLSHR